MVQKPEVTKLEVVDLSETELDPDYEQLDVQRKRDSGYAYNRSNRVSPSTRVRFRVNQSRGQVAFRSAPARLGRPFAKYGSPSHLNPTGHGHHGQQQHRNKYQQHHGHHDQQQSLGTDSGLTQQEVPSPIRNEDFTVANPIASQNNEPFGMHTASYLPPRNQKLPVYPTTDNFTPIHAGLQNNRDLVQGSHHQISDAALFLSENAQAIQQLYGAPASNQDFAPGNDHFQTDAGNRIPDDRFGNTFESTLQSPQEFGGALPSYASGTLSSHETLEQIQSLEKDRLIVQLQRALSQARNNPSVDGRYAQNQAGFIRNQELLASINQQMKSHTTPQSFPLADSAAFSQSPFLPGTTIDSLSPFPFNYGVSTTARIPTTDGTVLPSPQTPQSSKGDGSSHVASSQPAPNQPGSPATPGSPPVGIPVYGGFVPTVIAGASFIPSYGTGVLTSVRPVSGSGSPTHFGIPIPGTEVPGKPETGSPSIPATTTMTPSSFKPANQPGLALTPAITPVALPIQPIRPVAAPLHPLATQPPGVIGNPLPVLSVAGPAQVHPVQGSIPAVTSSVQHTYGVQTAQINPLVYKPVKAVYPLYPLYYPNVAYQLQKPALLPSHPWSYAPSYAQTKSAQMWK